jgi:hypothetical protein
MEGHGFVIGLPYLRKIGRTEATLKLASIQNAKGLNADG